MTRRARPEPPPKHPMFADSSIPADHKGNRRCRRCGVMGRPGDQRHTDEHPPVPEGDVSNRITGERE